MASQPPALDDILKTLSRFSSTPVPQSTASSLVGTPESGNLVSTPTADPRTRPRPLEPQTRTPTVDPSTITAWPQALKYVMSTLSHNPAATSRIKGLIRSQHQHEKQWWAGREALVVRHKGRDESKKKADALLRSLGANPILGNQSEDQNGEKAAEKKELEIYDSKVYRALSEMSRAMDGELRSLGIPFFAIKHELVESEEVGAGGNGTTLGQNELNALQKQMLQLLKDLFGE